MRSNNPMLTFRTGASARMQRHALLAVRRDDDDAAPVHLLQQVVDVDRNHVHDAEFHRFFRRVRFCLQHRSFQRFGRPAAYLGDGADHGRGILEDLVLERFVQVFALSTDRTRRADVRAGRHRGYVRRRGDERPGGRGVRPLRRDVDDHRHGRGQQGLRDVPRRAEQAAGRVERDDDGLGAAALRLFQRARDVALRDGADDAVHLDDVRLARLDLGQRNAGHTGGDEQHAHREQRRPRPRKEGRHHSTLK